MKAKNTYKIKDFKGNLTYEMISDKIKEYKDTNYGLYESGREYVDLELDEERIKEKILEANSAMELEGKTKLIEKNEMTRRRYCLILDYILNDPDSPWRERILNTVYEAVECEFCGYIGIKNGDDENWYCEKFEEIQKTPKF